MALGDFFRRTAGGLGVQQAAGPQAGGLGGGLFGGLSRFNEAHPGAILAAAQALKGEDIWPAVAYGSSVRKERATKAEKTTMEGKTKAYLKRVHGLSDEDAEAIIASGQAGSYFKAPKSESDMAEYGLVPQYGVDKDGNPVAIQLGKSGKATLAQLPEGVTLSKEPIKFDAGTHFVLLDPITRQPIGTIPKENYQEAFDTGRGTADAKVLSEAKAGLPGAEGIAGLIDSQIQDLKNDPYLPDMLGPINSRLPNISGDAARVQAKIDQIKGGAFLQARQLLKGGGAITDFEGQKAEAAYIRMNQAQSVEDFTRALDDFNAAVQQGLRKLQGQAGVAPAGNGNTTSGGVQWSIEP